MNKSAHYNVISIVVTRKTQSTVTYHLAHGLKGRTFTWGATTGRGRMTVDQLEIGVGYFIRTCTDEHGTQHWVEANKIVNGRMTDTEITRKVAAFKSKVEVKKDFLDDVMEW